MRLFSIFSILLLCISTAESGNIGLSTGYDLNYKTYSKTVNGDTYNSGSQMDKLYGALQYNRDLYHGKLGNIMLNADLNQYGLNYYDDRSPNPSVPFTPGGGSTYTNKLFHNINSILNLRLPKQKISMRIKWDDTETPQIDRNQYFQSLNKIKDDVRELEGINSSLDESKFQSTKNLYLHRSGKRFSFMGEVNHFRLNDSKIETAYVNDELTYKLGTDYKRWAGVFYELQDKQHNEERKNEKKSTIKLGLVNAFGNYTLYKFKKHFSLKAHLKREDTEYQNLHYLNDEGRIKLDWVKGPNTVINEYNYNETEDKDTQDQITTHRYQLFIQNQIKDRKSFFKYDIESSNVYRQTVQGLYLDEQDLPPALSGGLIGPGSVTFYTEDAPIELDISGLTVDRDETLDGSIIITRTTPYTVTFDTLLQGSVTVIDGEGEDIYAMYNRSKSSEYDLIKHYFELSHDIQTSRTFRSKTDVLGQFSDYTNKLINEDTELQEDTNQIWVRQLFEIRPSSFVFDLSGRYFYNAEGDRYYDRYEFKAKDGLYTENTKLYLETDLYTRNGKGYDAIFEQRYKLNGYKKGDKLTLTMDPYYMSKDTKGISTEVEKVFRGSAEYDIHSLDILWKNRSDKNKDETVSNIHSEETKLGYHLKSRHILFDGTFRTYEKDYEKKEYRTSLTFVTYKPMYQSSAHSKLTLSYEKDYSYLTTGNLEDDYIGIKIAYTPIFKIEAILSYEKQLRTHENSDDIEFLAKYDADTFSAGIGYRKMYANINNERKVEDVVFFQISKGVNFGRFMRF